MVTAIKKYHKLCGLNNKGHQRFNIKVWASLLLSEGCERIFLHASHVVYSNVLAIFGVLQHVKTSPSSLLWSSQTFCMCMAVSEFLLFIRIPVILNQGLTLFQFDSFYRIECVVILFLKKVRLRYQGVRTSTYNFEKMQCNP